MSRYLPFTTVGTTVQEMTSHEAMTSAGLDYQVERTDLVSGGVLLSKHTGLSKVTPDKIEVLDATVSSTQAIFQHDEVFATVDRAIGEVGAHYVAARELRGGLGMELWAKLPDTIQVAGFDPVSTYIRATNWNDGSKPFSMRLESWRMVCTNGLHSLTAKGNEVRLRHTKHADLSELQAGELFGMVSDHTQRITTVGDAMLNTDMTEFQFSAALDRLFPVDWQGSTRHINAVMKAREKAFSMLYAPTQDGIRDTAWGGYQSVVEYADWATASKTAAQRAERQLKGTYDGLKTRAFEVFTAGVLV